MTWDAARARAALDALHALGAMANATTPVRLRQMTANGSATSNGTELGTSGGYTQGAGAPSVTIGAATSPSTSQNSSVVSITNMPATTIVGVELWDSAGSPVRQELGSLSSSKTTVSGDTLSYAAGAYVSSAS